MYKQRHWLMGSNFVCLLACCWSWTVLPNFVLKICFFKSWWWKSDNFATNGTSNENITLLFCQVSELVFVLRWSAVWWMGWTWWGDTGVIRWNTWEWCRMRLWQWWHLSMWEMSQIAHNSIIVFSFFLSSLFITIQIILLFQKNIPLVWVWEATKNHKWLLNRLCWKKL